MTFSGGEQAADLPKPRHAAHNRRRILYRHSGRVQDQQLRYERPLDDVGRPHAPQTHWIGQLAVPALGLVNSPVFSRVVSTFGQSFAATARHQAWNVKLHPYRIVAREDATGEPSPEGLHRDGVDFIVSLMIRRVNVTGGVSTVVDETRQPLGSIELSRPGDFVVSDDRRTMHGVSSIKVADPKKALSYRDVLVIAFEKD